MRRFTLTLAMFATCLSAFAQGKVNMVNDSTRLVYLGSDVRTADNALAGQPVPLSGVLPSGIALLADLYGGADSNSMTLQTTAPFSSSIAGQFGPWSFVSANLVGGTTYTWQVKVRDSAFASAEEALSGGSYSGFSQIFTGRPGSSIAFFSINNALVNNFQSTWAAGSFSIGATGFGAIKVDQGLAGYFSTSPTSQSGYVGSNVTFLSVANFRISAEIIYQWRKDGTNISSTTGPSLTISNLSAGDAGIYDVIATNVYHGFAGAATSSPAILQVLPPNAPSISVNGQLALGDLTLSQTAVIGLSGGFFGGLIFYTLDGTTPTTSGMLYTGSFLVTSSVIVRAMSLSADFSQTSEAPAINVYVLPVYSLLTSVSGSGVIGLNPPTGPYASNSVVTLTAQASAYWAFDHWSGDLSGRSNPATLTMNGPRSVQAVFVPTAYPLTIGTPGGGSVTANGQSIAANTYYPTGSVVSLEATPAGGWSFLRWQGTASSSSNPYNISMSQVQNVQAIFGTVVSSNIAGNGSIVMSTTNPVSYGTALTNTAVPASGYYFVTWTGAASGTNNPTAFTVTTATPMVGALFAATPSPTILTQPSNATVLVGDAASFHVQASGAAPLSYQWRKAGSNIVSATGTNYTITSTTAADAGGYDVIVQNGFGSTVTSVVATLTVLVPVTITSQPVDQVAAFAGSASFAVGAHGNPMPYYQWLFNGAFVTNALEASLTITNIGTNALGDYSVIAWNSFSVVTSSVAKLFMSPSIRTPFVGGTAVWGHETSLMVGAVGSGMLTYQWYLNGSPVFEGTNATLNIASVQFTNGGLYSVIVSSAYGSATNIPYQLVIYPADVSLNLRASLTIGGVVGYGYEIQYSTNLADTNSWISITNLTLTQPVEIWVDTSVDVRDQPKRYYKVLPQ